MDQIVNWTGGVSNAAQDGLEIITGAASALSGTGNGLQNDTPSNASSSEGIGTKHHCSGLACVDTKVDDQKLLTSLGWNGMMGAGTLLLFIILHSRIAVYKIRTILPQVTIKPPRLKQKGWESYWRWINIVFTTSDQDLLASAGMDALMLVKTMAFGIQLFLPLTIVAICVLIPMHKSGGYLVNGGRHFEAITISNTPPGSQDFWVHFVCIYAFIGYALILLYIHQKRFVELRHHYLTAGDDPNLWRIRYQSVEEQADNQKAPRIADAAAHITKFLKKAAGLERVIDKEYVKPKGLLSTAAKTDKIQDAKKLLVDLQSKDENTEENDDLTRDLNTNLEAVEEQEGGQRAGASSPSGSKASEEQDSSSQADGNREETELGGEKSNAEEITCLQQLSSSFVPPRNNTRCKSIAESNVPTVLKWWNVDDEHFDEEDSLPRHHLQRGVHTARPSVRFLKTVNTEDLISGAPVAVNAQHYCVLLTDVPKLEKILKREEQKLEKKKQNRTTTLYKIFSAIWYWAVGGFNFKDYNHAHSSENEHLLGKRDRGVDPEVMKKYGSGFLPVSSKLEKTEGNNSGKKLLRGASKWGKVAEKVRTHEIFHLDECVVANSFKSLFPDDFVKAMPIRVHKKIDLMLNEWEKVAAALEVQEYKLSKTGNHRIVYPQRRWWSWLLFCQYGNGPPANAINHLNEKLTKIEAKILTARRTIMMNPPSSTWLLIFKTQFAATVAAQTLLHSESGHKFQAHPAPGPDEMNWQALWKTWFQKDTRKVLVFPLVAFVIMFPLGLFAGGLSKVFTFFCDPDEDNDYYIGHFYCNNGEGGISIRSLITAWMPSILVSIWQNAVMPNLLYCLVQMQASCISLSALDREIAGLFFLWDVLNIFVGGMLGGTIFSRMTDMVKGTVSIVEMLGKAVPASSNFFINYVVLRAFFLVPFQLMLPHPGVWQYLIRLAGGIKARTARAKTMVWKPRSVRYGREYGIFMLVYVITLVYAVIAPIIIPLSLVYFFMSWVVWRYQVLYVFVRKYEGGGQMWPFVFNRILIILWFFQVFTSCILTVKKAYWEAAILWVTVPVILIKYWRYCEGRFKSGMDYVPLEMAKMAPSAEIDPKVYTPPALIQGCAGWHPEYMTAWEGWGSPRYCW